MGHIAGHLAAGGAVRLFEMGPLKPLARHHALRTRQKKKCRQHHLFCLSGPHAAVPANGPAANESQPPPLPALFDPLRGRLVTSHSTKESGRPSAVGYRPKLDIGEVVSIGQPVRFEHVSDTEVVAPISLSVPCNA
jgi:hypothetical protein